jgi:hypothetical protein
MGAKEILRLFTNMRLSCSSRRSCVAASTARQPKLSDIFTQKREVYTDSEDTKSADKASKAELRMTYRNKLGDEMLFRPCDPPKGYAFVPSGNRFITRTCCRLAHKVYAVYPGKIRTRPEGKSAFMRHSLLLWRLRRTKKQDGILTNIIRRFSLPIRPKLTDRIL